MTEMVVEIPCAKWGKQRTFELDKGFKDAVRDYCKRRWPHHTAKYAAREFDLTVDQGRAVANGTASMTTIEKVLKVGKAPVAIPVIEDVIGMKLVGFFRQTLITAAGGAADALDHEEHASAAYRLLAGGADRPGGDRDGSAPSRQARGSLGALGAQEARGVARSP